MNGRGWAETGQRTAEALVRDVTDQLGAAGALYADRARIAEKFAQDCFELGLAAHAAAMERRADAADMISAARERRRAAEAQRYAEVAEQVSAELGRRPGYRYRGGPVDWETGLPVGSACAWLRRARTRTTASKEARRRAA